MGHQQLDNGHKRQPKHKSRYASTSSVAATPPTSRSAIADDRATINRTKTRLRSVRRLLENKSEDMAGDQRQNLEREHASLQDDLKDLMRKAQYKKVVSKYHKIRFFERRKAERALKKVQKHAAEAQEDQKAFESELHKRQTDLNYTLYFPLSVPYASLYTKEHKDDHAPNRSSPLWTEVEAAMEQGTLEQLRNRPLAAANLPTLPLNYASAAPGNRSDRKQPTSADAPPTRLTTARGDKRIANKRARHTNADSDDDGESFFCDG